MAKSTTSKTTSKSKVGKTKKKSAPAKEKAQDPKQAIRRTVASASKLVESLVAVIEKEVQGGESEELFGPRGAIANLHKLVQVLDKLSDQLELLKPAKTVKAPVMEPLSNEERQLLEDWLKSED